MYGADDAYAGRVVRIQDINQIAVSANPPTPARPEAPGPVLLPLPPPFFTPAHAYAIRPTGGRQDSSLQLVHPLRSSPYQYPLSHFLVPPILRRPQITISRAIHHNPKVQVEVPRICQNRYQTGTVSILAYSTRARPITDHPTPSSRTAGGRTLRYAKEYHYLNFVYVPLALGTHPSILLDLCCRFSDSHHLPATSCATSTKNGLQSTMPTDVRCPRASTRSKLHLKTFLAFPRGHAYASIIFVFLFELRNANVPGRRPVTTQRMKPLPDGILKARISVHLSYSVWVDFSSTASSLPSGDADEWEFFSKAIDMLWGADPELARRKESCAGSKVFGLLADCCGTAKQTVKESKTLFTTFPTNIVNVETFKRTRQL
ncbi:hypothetical protein FIBSPDRAFT_936844 [Athelia psychrophila]|uniref:Uncharacterized protein n=1 Tax=Athelia psychrophila TaxID=1759441 RepID=A0A166BFJ7_9AGAM|nr:hypothetical protein FIBSPDRAFT_936844 [Fibularhizoctonia sp. CBS 109695]